MDGWDDEIFVGNHPDQRFSMSPTRNGSKDGLQPPAPPTGEHSSRSARSPKVFSPRAAWAHKREEDKHKSGGNPKNRFAVGGGIF